MTEERKEEVVREKRTTRRELLRRGAVGGVVIGYGGLGGKTKAYGATKYKNRQFANELKIMQWSHFVPSYDRWLDNEYVKQWGAANDTDVKIDHVNNAELPARAAAQVAAQSGHDLFQFLAPPASHEDNVIPLNDVVTELNRKLGKMHDVAYKSSYNPKTKRYFGVADNYVPDPVNYRRSLFFNVGSAPNSWEDIRKAAPKLRAAGHPVGLGMSQELDSNMMGIALLQCYGGLIQNEEHRVTLNSKGTRDALNLMRDIYKNGMSPEVFAWTAASNNQAFNAGRLSLTLNAISISRVLEGPPWTTTAQNKELMEDTWIAPIPRGPARRMGLEHVMGVYVIWKFAQNKEGAKKFLIDQQLNYTKHFTESGFYNFPAWPNAVKDSRGKGFPAIRRYTAADQFKPKGKYTILTTIAQKYTANVGWPGFSNAGVDEVFNKFLVPQMFAQVAQEKMSAAEAARTFDRQVREIFQKWRDLKKI
jgi:multiple sugar transport system substrate-binding protein